MRSQGTGSVFQRKQDGLWVAQLSLPSRDGGRRRKSSVHPTKKKAEAALLDMQIELKKHGDLPTDSQTVEQFFTYWLDALVAKDVRPNTYSNYKGVTQNWINPVIGTTRLSKATPAHVRRVTDAMLEDGKSSTYALNAHRIMSAAFTVAEQEGRIARNPAKVTKAPRKSIANLEALTATEAIRLLQAVADDPNGALWATYLLTGARRGEIIGLEWNRVTDILDLSWQMQRFETGARDTRGEVGKPIVPPDFEYRHVKGGLYLTRPKTKRGWRIIPLVEPLRSIIARHLATSGANDYGLVFTEDGRPWDPDRVTKAWNDVLSRVGIEKRVRLHDVRHTTVDLLFEAEVPEAVIQEIVGHSTRAMTRAYKSRGNRAELEKAMLALSALVTPSPGDAAPPSTGSRSPSSTRKE